MTIQSWILERSIRDILAISKLEKQQIPSYIPCLPKGGESAFEMDFLEALEELRTDLLD